MQAGTFGAHRVDVLTTGVGMVATATWCSRALVETPYDAAFNFGVCGSFDPQLPPGTVVHVTSDRLAELGAEDDERFLTVQELGLVAADEFPYRGGMLVNRRPPANTALRALPQVSAVTVNTVHGSVRSIAAVSGRFAPQVESMEGAAFMYACLVHGVPLAQVRAVSNVVEKRNRGAWQLELAIAKLGAAAAGILERP